MLRTCFEGSIPVDRELSHEALCYLTLPPSENVSFLGSDDRIKNIKQFVDLRHEDLVHNRLDHVDPLEVNAAAFANLELGYLAVRQQGVGKLFEGRLGVLAPFISGSRNLFEYVAASVERYPERENDPELYRAILAKTALKFAFPLRREPLQQFRTEQRMQELTCLSQVQAQFDLIPPDEQVQLRALRLRAPQAEIVISSLLDRDLPSTSAPKILCSPAFTRHRNSFSRENDERWDVNVWKIDPLKMTPELCLFKPPYLKFRISHGPKPNKKPDGNVKWISLTDDILLSRQQSDIKQLVDGLIAEGNGQWASLARPVRALVNQCTMRARERIDASL